MPYRLWHYACKLVAIPMFACAPIGMLIDGTAGRIVAGSAILILVCLGLVGAVMGVLMTMGKLRMRCPFCRRSGRAWGSKREGMRMDCPTCGLIWTGGALGLTFFREHPLSDPPEPRDPAAR